MASLDNKPEEPHERQLNQVLLVLVVTITQQLQGVSVACVQATWLVEDQPVTKMQWVLLVFPYEGMDRSSIRGSRPPVTILQ